MDSEYIYIYLYRAPGNDFRGREIPERIRERKVSRIHRITGILPSGTEHSRPRRISIESAVVAGKLSAVDAQSRDDDDSGYNDENDESPAADLYRLL